MSVIKTSEIFIKADKDLKKRQLHFINQTKKTHNGGSITINAALFTVMLSGLLAFFALKFKVELNEARYRKDSYLCFHFLNIKTQNYTAEMSYFNTALKSAYLVAFTGVATAKAKAVHEALKIARNGRHFYFIKNLLSNPYCKDKKAIIAYIKKFPYLLSPALSLKTQIDSTSIIRSPKWEITYYQTPSGIRVKKSFCLKANMALSNSLSSKLELKTQEIPMADFSKLKCLSGFL